MSEGGKNPEDQFSNNINDFDFPEELNKYTPDDFISKKIIPHETNHSKNPLSKSSSKEPYEFFLENLHNSSENESKKNSEEPFELLVNNINEFKENIYEFSTFSKEKFYYDLPDELKKNIIDHQNKVISQITEDPTLPDYESAYARLISERNKPWKLNPTDIADFYLLEGFIRKNSGPDVYNEDSRHMAVMKARERVSEIGRRLLIAMTYEQLDEYDRWTVSSPGKVSSELAEKIKTHNALRLNTDLSYQSDEIGPADINKYLSSLHAKLGKAALSHKDRIDDPEMFSSSLELLESQQSGRWKTMATLMRALDDKDFPVEKVLEGLGVKDIDQSMIDEISKNREIFLIDRLINYVHNTGRMSARITNYFPRSAALLLAHGIPGHEDYLYYYSSLITSTDNLSKLIQNDINNNPKRNIVEDFVGLINTGKLPREYMYSLLLEISDPRIKEAVLQNTSDNISPTHIYTLLQRISHHDGVANGKIQKAA